MNPSYPSRFALLISLVLGLAQAGLAQEPATPTTPPTQRVGGTQTGMPQLSPQELQALANSHPVPNEWAGLSDADRAKALNKQLQNLGDQVKKGDALHNQAMKEYQQKVEQARRQYPAESPEQHKALQKATQEYTQKSQQIEQQYRQPAQKKLIDLTNRANNVELKSALNKAGVEVPKNTSPDTVMKDLKAKAAAGNPAAKQALGKVDASLKNPGELTPTQGTPSGDPGHRGWEGDTDAGASTQRTNRMEKIANKMGLTTKGQPGYTNVKGMDLTAHKQGSMGPPGSAAHKTQIGVDAASKETYVHQAMKKGQPGRSHVAVQDHTKKALPGLKKTPAELFKSPAELQSMSKGTLKSLKAGNLSNAQIEQIMKNNNIKGTPEQFKKLLENLKGNGSHAPDGYAKNLNQKTMKNLQGACADVIKQAHKNTYKQAKTQIARTESRIKSLEGKANELAAKGDKAGAAKLRQQAQVKRAALVDTKTRMQSTRGANRATIKGTPPGQPPSATTPTPGGKRGGIKINLKPGGTPPPPGGGPAARTPPTPPKGPLGGGSAGAKVRPRPPSTPPGTVGAVPPVRVPVTPPRPGILRTPIGQLVGPRVTTGFNVGMTVIGLYGMYQGIKQGVTDAVADSDAANEGDIKRGLRGGAYALWYGLGFKSMADVGREEGNTFMDGYHAELYLNGIRPDSWRGRMEYVKAKALSVGSAVSRVFLEPAHDLMAESTGLLGDLWTWWKASKAEKEMAERLKKARARYISSRHTQKDWYCTNRPEIVAPVVLPPILRMMGAPPVPIPLPMPAPAR